MSTPHNILLEHPIRFEQTINDANFTIFTELFAKLDHTVLPICDNRLISFDYRIPIGCNTF